METIGEQKIWTFSADAPGAGVAPGCTAIRAGSAHRVGSFLELASKIAELQFLNREFVLFLRGQSGDWTNSRGHTTLKPSIMRPSGAAKLPSDVLLSARFARLLAAEKILEEEYVAAHQPGIERLRRHRSLRWAILQHYEVCPTPLLDVTQSLRIAASHACDLGPDRDDLPEEAHVFVLGVSAVSGAVTASAETGMQILRLASVCPPVAVRPHIQEGYLLGLYPDLDGTAQRQIYGHYETDFGRRLVAKFVFDPRRFWADEAFPRVPRGALYPDDDDPMHRLAEMVRNRLNDEAPAPRDAVTSKPKPARSRAR